MKKSLKLSLFMLLLTTGIFSSISTVTVSAVNSTNNVRDFEEEKKYVTIFPMNVTKIGVNKIIINDLDFYYEAYGEKIGSKKMATYILQYALKYEIPINLAFALAHTESGYNNSAQRKNKNGTVDFGVFQLNSRYYKDMKKYGTLEGNIHFGLLHLKTEYDKYKSFDIAVGTYNCGNVGNLSKSLEHIEKVLEREKKLDEWFNDIYRDKIYRTFGGGEISTP